MTAILQPMKTFLILYAFFFSFKGSMIKTPGGNFHERVS
jgi:hypothetical protein